MMSSPPPQKIVAEVTLTLVSRDHPAVIFDLQEHEYSTMKGFGRVVDAETFNQFGDERNRLLVRVSVLERDRHLESDDSDAE